METFKDIINGDKPVLVDFFATWCGPCKVMSPTVEALGKELVGQARVLKIDVDKNEAVQKGRSCLAYVRGNGERGSFTADKEVY